MSHKTIITRENKWTTPFWSTNIEEWKVQERKVSYNEDLIQFIISEAEKDKENKIRKSNRGGWQSRTDLFKDPATKELCEKIWDCSKTIFPFVKNMRISQMWAAVNKKYNSNVIHQHGEYDISGAYYLQVPPNSGRIVFRDPRPSAIASYFHTKIEGELYHIIPKECDLMFWPAFIDHFVETSYSDNDRIMISFDLKFTTTP